MRECERVVAPLVIRVVLTFVVVLEITEVFAASGPAKGLALGALGGELLEVFISSVGVDQHFHAFVVQALGLDHVQDVELYFLTAGSVGDSEEEPLGVTLRIYVVLKDQIVLVVILLVGELKVSGLKSRLENEGLVFEILGLVVIAPRELKWVRELLVLLLIVYVGLCVLDDFLEVASSNQLVEIILVESLLRIVELLPESGVDDWVLLPLGEFGLVLEVEEVAEEALVVLWVNNDLLNLLSGACVLFIIH